VNIFHLTCKNTFSYLIGMQKIIFIKAISTLKILKTLTICAIKNTMTIIAALFVIAYW
jgi:hypothetical protein